MSRSGRGWIYHFFRNLFYPWISRVRLLQADIEALKKLEEEGQLLFVGNAASFVDFIIVNDQLVRHGLKPLSFTHGFNPFYVLPFGRALSVALGKLKGEAERRGSELDELVGEAVHGENGYVFLKRAPRFMGKRVHYYHRFFGKLAMHPDRQHKTFLIPTSVFLTRHRKKNLPRTFNDIFFGTYDIPGRPRKLFQLLVNYQKGGTVFSDHIDLNQEIAQAEDMTEAKVDKRLRWVLLFHLNKEERAYRGPNKRTRSRKVQKILRERRLQAELEQVAERTGRSPESVMKEAAKTLHEMASDTSERVVNIMRILFDFVWARTLESIDFKQEDIDNLRELNKSGPVIIMPCHRSHVDYLVVQYMFETQGLNYPRIAAGDNLSKWPLGLILRRCGAFFLRRSFRGETIFPLVFEAYLRHTLRERHNMIFFIEGGRSRTGKLLHPKMGMMSMLVDAWREGIVEDLPLVPVTIDYGKVFEGQSYLREKSGLPKRKEDIGSVLNSRKVLGRKHGVLRLRFGDPIYLAEFVREYGLSRETLGFKKKVPLTNDLSYRVLRQVNRQVTLTAGNVVASLLMGNPRRGITQSDLRALFIIVVRYLRHRHVELAFDDPNLDIAIDNALGTFVEWDTLVRVEVGGEVVVNIPEAKRSEMEYYKNNGLHFVLGQSLMFTAFLCLPEEQRTRTEIGALAREIYGFLIQEFLEEKGFPEDEEVERLLNAMTRIDALEERDGLVCWGTYPLGRDLVRIGANQLANFLESYFVVAEMLTELSSETPIDRKVFLKHCMARAKLLYAVGMLSRQESINHVSFGNALKRFADDGIVQMRTVKGQKQPVLTFNENKRDQYHEMRNRLFDWIEHLN